MPRVERSTSTISIPIGDWNMKAEETKSVPHKLKLSDIFSVVAMVRNDENTQKYQAMGVDGGFIQLSIESIDETNINLWRKSGGIFDSTDFDSTEYGRGWVTIVYSPSGVIY
mgnify:CR=1 FL=1